MQMLDAVINLKDNFSDTLKTVEKNVGEFQRTYKRTGRDIQRTGRTASRIGGTLTKAFTAPLLGAGAAATKIGIDFESSMSEVQAVTQASSSEMEMLEKAARDAGANTSKSAKEAADALGYMGLAGWNVKDSIDGLLPVLKLSEAGNLDLGRASDLVTDSMSAMGIEVQELDKYLDVIAQTARSSNTDIDAMMEAYLGVGGVLRGLNIELEESAVALGLLADAGIKGSEGGKALSAILTNLTAPTGRAKKALDELNFTAFDSEGNFKGLDNVLFELKDSMSGMTTEQKNNYRAMIAGKEHTKGLNALLNGLDDTYDELSASVKDSNGALDEMRDTMKDNLKGTLEEIKSALEEVGLQIFDVLQPGLETGAKKIKEFAQTLNDLSPEQIEMITQIAKMAIVIGPTLMLLGKMTGTVGKLVTEFGFFAQRVGNVGFLSAIFTPGLKVVLILAALAAAAVIVYKNWDKIKETFQNVKEKLDEMFGLSDRIEFLKELLSGMADNLKEKMLEAWEAIEPLREKIGDLMSALGEFAEMVAPILMPILDFIGGVFAVGFAVAFNTVVNIVSTVVSTIATVLGGIIDILTGVLKFVTGVFTGDWEMAMEGIELIVDGVVGIISGLWEGLIDLLTAPIDAVVNLIDNKFGEKAEGIIEAWGKVKDFLKNPIKGTVNLVRRGAGWVGSKLGIGQNYKGTMNWRGGPTWVHERGGEIIDLPQGTRIYPHDKSVQMARQEGASQSNRTVTIDKLAETIVVREDADIDKIATALAKKLQEAEFNTA